MKKELLKKIAKEQATESEVRKFDTENKESLMLEPSTNFTELVMASLPSGNTKLGLHIWGIVVGVAVVMVLWALGGFVTPEMSLTLKLPETLSSLKMQTIEMTAVTKYFMMANGLLLLLVIDRMVQLKKRTT